MKLADVVQKWAARCYRNPTGLGGLTALALDRCEGTGHEQYVTNLGERWETVPRLLLAQDIREELADALNYVCALVERTGDKALLDAIPYLATAYQTLDSYPHVIPKEGSQ